MNSTTSEFATLEFAARNEQIFGTPSPVCFVTGSLSARVGRAIAQHLAQRGFRAVLHGRQNSGSPPAETNFASHVVYGEVQRESNIETWLNETIEKLGRVDLLVNSAAIWDPQPLEETSADDFQRYFETNTLGPALLCKHFGMQMTEQPHGGAIINIGDWAVRRPYRDFAAYFVSKGAIRTLTESMAVELASRNPKLRVSAVLPGPVLLAEDVNEEREREIAQQCILQRSGRAEDVAEAVHFLAMSPFVTGVCLPVDGGRSIFAGPTKDIAHPDVQT